MSTERLVADKYARALLQLAQEQDQLEEVRADLETVGRIFGSGGGRELLIHPLLPLEQKHAAARKMIEGKVGPLILSLLRLLIDKRRGGLVSEIVDAYRAELHRLQGRRSATVTASIPLTEEQMDALRRKLSALVGAEVELTQVTDPALRGGARITLGDVVLDGTLDARLEQLRRVLSRENLREN